MENIQLTHFNSEFVIDEKEAKSIFISKAVLDRPVDGSLHLVVKDENGSELINKPLNEYQQTNANQTEIQIEEHIGIFKLLKIYILSDEPQSEFHIDLYFDLK